MGWFKLGTFRNVCGPHRPRIGAAAHILQIAGLSVQPLTLNAVVPFIAATLDM